MSYYYKFTADTNYRGTENTYFAQFDEKPSEKELESMAIEYAEENATDFDYLVHGWEMTAEDCNLTQEEFDEEIEIFHEEAFCEWEEITEEEYFENIY